MLAGHGRHARPGSYVPAAHNAHGPPGGPQKLVLHTQAVMFAENGSEQCCIIVLVYLVLHEQTILALVEYDPSGHCIQGKLPLTPLYVPAGHAKQSNPVYPT